MTSKDIADLSNYCRNPDSDVNGPWCLVGHSVDVMDMQYCDIDACGKYGRSNDIATCTLVFVKYVDKQLQWNAVTLRDLTLFTPL